MTTFKKGDIILIPFPFTDITTTKQRPALIVSSNQFHHQRNDIIVMAISSQIWLLVDSSCKRFSPEVTVMPNAGLP